MDISVFLFNIIYGVISGIITAILIDIYNKIRK